MNKDNIRLRRLGSGDVVTQFDCGDDDLNDFLLTDAPLYYRVRLATSYVLEDGESGDVIGYFSLAHDRISLTELDFYFKQGFVPLSKADAGAETRLLYFDLASLATDNISPTP